MALSERTDDGAERLGEPPNLESLRERYRAERDRRLRSDGVAQWVSTQTGEHATFGVDPWSDRPEPRKPLADEVDVTIVGAGFAALIVGAYLRKQGVNRIRLVDVSGDVGGTWYWNRYPGLTCDIESYIYLPMLEEIGIMPSRKYVPGNEIHRHARAMAEKFDLYRDALFHTAVTSAHWDEDAQRWNVTTDKGDLFRTRYVVLGSGTQDHPKLPGIPGIEEFAGRMFHTSRWDYEFTGGDMAGGLTKLSDKRVAVIGTGATAIQVVPQVAEHAEHLYVVQRTPSGVDTRDDAPTDEDWWKSLEPGWQQARRLNFLQMVHGAGAPENLVGDKWTDTASPRGMARLKRGEGVDDPSLTMELADREKMAELRARVAQVVRDPATAAALQPWYRQFCKRPTFSDRYLQVFNQDNVTLLDTDGKGVERITADGLVIGGVEYPVDAVVFATGYELGADPATRAGVDLRGRGGQPLSEYWADGLRTLHGWVCRDFPNLFHTGTSQNSHAVNFTHILEEQGRHIAEVVGEADRRGDVLVEPTEEAQTDWVEQIRAGYRMAQYDFTAECTPGYFNYEGKPKKGSDFFSGGPVAFHELLREWRENGGMDSVLGTPIRP